MCTVSDIGMYRTYRQPLRTVIPASHDGPQIRLLRLRVHALVLEGQKVLASLKGTESQTISDIVCTPKYLTKGVYRERVGRSSVQIR